MKLRMIKDAPGKYRWFTQDHEEYAAFSWKEKFRFLPSIRTMLLSGDRDNSHHTLLMEWLWFAFNIQLCESSFPEDMNRTYGWGVSFHDDYLDIRLGHKGKMIDLPFVRLLHQETHVLNYLTMDVVFSTKGKKFSEYYEEKEEAAKRHSKTFPFCYRLRSGEEQKVNATIFVSRMIWRRKWTPFKYVKTYIDISFDGEVGPRAGSWKGGCIGCSYKLLPHETPLDCLRRLEKDTKFFN